MRTITRQYPVLVQIADMSEVTPAINIVSDDLVEARNLMSHFKYVSEWNKTVWHRSIKTHARTIPKFTDLTLGVILVVLKKGLRDPPASAYRFGSSAALR